MLDCSPVPGWEPWRFCSFICQSLSVELLRERNRLRRPLPSSCAMRSRKPRGWTGARGPAPEAACRVQVSARFSTFSTCTTTSGNSLGNTGLQEWTTNYLHILSAAYVCTGAVVKSFSYANEAGNGTSDTSGTISDCAY